MAFWNFSITSLQKIKCKILTLTNKNWKSGAYKKYDNIATNFGPPSDENVINKAYLDTEISKIEDHISYIEKAFNEYNLLSNKQSVEWVLRERAVKGTNRIL